MAKVTALRRLNSRGSLGVATGRYALPLAPVPRAAIIYLCRARTNATGGRERVLRTIELRTADGGLDRKVFNTADSFPFQSIRRPDAHAAVLRRPECTFAYSTFTRVHTEIQRSI